MINDLVISQIRQRLEILYQMVDELETSGGGGGQGGVTDYNDLTSKPKIGGVTLQGDKSASSLGLATSTALDTLSTAVTNLTERVGDLFAVDSVSISQSGVLPAAVQTRVTAHEPININSDQYYFVDETGVDYLYANTNYTGAFPSITYLRIKKNSWVTTWEVFATTEQPVQNSNNFVTSGGVYSALQNKANIAPVADLINTGVKNLLKNTGTTQTIRGVTFTVNDDGTVTVNGTNNTTSTAVFYLNVLPAATASSYNGCRLTGCPQGGSASTYRLSVQLNSGSYTTYASDTGEGATIRNVPSSDCRVGIFVYAGTTVNNLVFKPMICTLENYVISPEYTPYAPSNRELYEMILALQNP